VHGDRPGNSALTMCVVYCRPQNAKFAARSTSGASATLYVSGARLATYVGNRAPFPMIGQSFDCIGDPPCGRRLRPPLLGVVSQDIGY
jgi:hypothetical protein